MNLRGLWLIALMATSTHAAHSAPTQDLIPGGLAVIPLGQSENAPSVSFNTLPTMVIFHDGQWQALVGIPLAQTLGTATAITAQGAVSFDVKAHPYPEQHLTVRKNQVNPSAEELARIRKESALMSKVYKSFSAPRSFNGMIWPVSGRKSSDFGLRRFFNGEERNPHSGFDIAAPTGTPVMAPAAGKVVLTGDFFFNGKSVFIDHGQGLITMLCHLNSIDISEGTEVSAGTFIGTVGSTGRSTGPHLHWTTSLNNARINPLLLLNANQPDAPEKVSGSL